MNGATAGRFLRTVGASDHPSALSVSAGADVDDASLDWSGSDGEGLSGSSGSDGAGSSGPDGEGVSGSSGSDGAGSLGSSGSDGAGSLGSSGSDGEGASGSSGADGEGESGFVGFGLPGEPGFSGLVGSGLPGRSPDFLPFEDFPSVCSSSSCGEGEEGDSDPSRPTPREASESCGSFVLDDDEPARPSSGEFPDDALCSPPLPARLPASFPAEVDDDPASVRYPEFSLDIGEIERPTSDPRSPIHAAATGMRTGFGR